MCKINNKSDAIACDLADPEKWLSHGHGINYEKAKELGLNINYMDKENALWGKIWNIYVSYFSERITNGKIFESHKVYLAFSNQGN
jgi:hypothetical protein